MSTGGYKINEKDIDSVINFLKIHDPENATPEMAIALLEHFHARFHELSHTNPEELLKILNELKSKKKAKN